MGGGGGAGGGAKKRETRCDLLQSIRAGMYLHVWCTRAMLCEEHSICELCYVYAEKCLYCMCLVLITCIIMYFPS